MLQLISEQRIAFERCNVTSPAIRIFIKPVINQKLDSARLPNNKEKRPAESIIK